VNTNDLNAKIVAFFLPGTTQINDLKIGLFGLENGFWNAKLTKH
jgi:hypothetical protein